jgi:hypothetical protein
MNPTWEVYCLACGKVAEDVFGDPMEKAAIQHKRSYPCHIVLIASEILPAEVA